MNITNTKYAQGPRCDRCEKGYRRYPACEPCPCDRAGSKGDECEGDCECKVRVRDRGDMLSSQVFILKRISSVMHIP